MFNINCAFKHLLLCADRYPYLLGNFYVSRWTGWKKISRYFPALRLYAHDFITLTFGRSESGIKGTIRWNEDRATPRALQMPSFEFFAAPCALICAYSLQVRYHRYLIAIKISQLVPLEENVTRICHERKQLSNEIRKGDFVRNRNTKFFDT